MGGQILSYKAAEIRNETWKEAWNAAWNEATEKANHENIRKFYPLLLGKEEPEQAVSELATTYKYDKSKIIEILGPAYKPQPQS